MNTSQINSLLESFSISKNELDSRVVLREFAYSLSSIIVDDFAKKYLLNNPNLSIYLAQSDGGRLLKKIKDFFVFILIEPVDEEYVKRIYSVGSTHFSIKLEPAKVSYGFWAINEVLTKMAEVNEIVKVHRPLISKLLKFVEHLMNDGYYIQKEKQHPSNTQEFHGINAQNELYIGFNTHKLNVQKIEQAVSEGSLSAIENIQENSDKCAFGKILKVLSTNQQHEYILGVNTESVRNTHNKWHVEFVKLKHAMQENNATEIKIYKNNINVITNNLKNILDSALDNSLKDGQLALNSGIRSMRNMTELFYEKNYNQQDSQSIDTSIKDIIERAFLVELNWAIEDIKISFDNSLDKSYDVVKIIRYNNENIQIQIKLKANKSSSYIREMLVLLLEVLELHFSIREREVSLISFADKAEHANKSKDMFLANMSHELRTPLNAITGFSQILMMKKDTPESVKQYVQKINIAGNNLLDLVNTILDFAKLEAGKMQFSPSLTNISNVLNEVSTLVSQLALKKNITLKMPNIVSLNLYIDSKLFRQVLTNLLSNAIKFTHENGEVSLSIVYDVHEHIYRFEVKDNGVGLSQEAISKLFQPFSQIDNAYQKEHKGTGLGLMICKKIIEDLHKGKLWVESIEGEGSSFFITMPTPMMESYTYTIDIAPAGSKNILIVEDSESYQKLLAEHLQETHVITFTDSINKAKGLLSKKSYDFVILDFFLTDGISSEILQFMEREHISIPVIVISAEDDINISSSLAQSTNLEGIFNKNNIPQICASIRGEAYKH